MRNWVDCRAVEAEGFAILRPYLDEKTDGHYVMTDKGKLARWLQESVGDVLLNPRQNPTQVIAVECKFERRHTGNLFIETWSNKNLNDIENHAQHGSNPGWLFKLRADLLFYYFIDQDVLYSVDVFELQRWSFGFGSRNEPVRGRLASFPEVMADASQKNDTWGHLVDWHVLKKELPSGAVRRTQVRQREMFDVAA